MLRLPAQLEIGPYTIHLDVLAARLQQRRRRIRRVLTSVLTLIALLTVVWLTLPQLRGRGVVIIPAYPADVRLTLDGQPVHPGLLVIASGDHPFTAEKPGAFPFHQVIQVTRDQTTTLTLPPLRPLPLVQLLPLTHQQSTWSQVSADAGGGWRLQATRQEPQTTTGMRPGWGPSPAATPSYVLHLDTQGLTRLSILETYPVADEVIGADGERFWAMWGSQDGPKAPGVAGMLTITTPAGTTVISTTEPLRGVWWAPRGHALLVALPHDQGHDLAIIDPRRPGTAPRRLITVPGAVKSVHWHPDGRAAVVLTAIDAPPQSPAQGAPRPGPTALPAEDAETALGYNAVLVLLPPDGEPQATRLRAPPIRTAGLLPLAWTHDALWWVTDTGLGLALDRADLADGASGRIGSLPDTLVALTVMPDDHTVRVIRGLPDGTLQVERWPDGAVLFTLPGVQGGALAGGAWRDGDLLLATSPTSLWYIRIAMEALQ